MTRENQRQMIDAVLSQAGDRLLSGRRRCARARRTRRPAAPAGRR